jgi:hypothetical protein
MPSSVASAAVRGGGLVLQPVTSVAVKVAAMAAASAPFKKVRRVIIFMSLASWNNFGRETARFQKLGGIPVDFNSRRGKNCINREICKVTFTNKKRPILASRPRVTSQTGRLKVKKAG